MQGIRNKVTHVCVLYCRFIGWIGRLCRSFSTKPIISVGVSGLGKQPLMFKEQIMIKGTYLPM